MALGCVHDSRRRIYRPVVSDFDQGGGSGVDEPGTSNPNRVAVFFTCAESAVFGGRPSVFPSVFITVKIDGGSHCSLTVTSEENPAGMT